MTESPGGATVRSVRVKLDLDIAAYEAKANRAGRVTESMAQRIDRSFTRVNRNLVGMEKGLDGVSVSEKRVEAATRTMNTRLGETDRVLGRNSKQLDTFTGRARLALEAIAAFGPALVPLGGIALAAVGGVASQLGFAAAAGGSAILAFQGVGDSLKAIEKARLDPTVANLEAARVAVSRLAPEAQVLVRHLQDLRDEGRELQFAAAGGFLPGVDSALTDLESRIPEAKRILAEISDAAGDAIADGAESLASDRWDKFFTYLETEARPQLDALADSTGNVAHGFAELFAATAGLQGDFSGWMRDSTESFDEWATRLGSSTEYAEFVDYVRTNGPQVAETLGATATAIIQIVEAAAPLGGPALQVLETLADVVSAIADSDLGTPILTGLAALSLYTRATKLLGVTGASSLGQIVRGQKQVDLGYARGSAFVTTMGRDLGNVARYGTLATESSKRLGSQLATAGRAAGPIAGLALASSGAADSIGLSNTASLALMGTLAGPWGAALGAGVGLTMDLAAANDSLEDSIRNANAAIESGDVEAMLQRRKELVADIADQDISGGRNFGFDDVGGLINNLTGQTDEARDSLREVDDALADAGRTAGIFGVQIDVVAIKEAAAAQAAQELSADLSALSGWFDRREAIRNYNESLRELSRSMRNGFTRQDVENLDAVGRNMIQVAKTITDPGQQAVFLENAKATLRDLARGAGPEAKAAINQIIQEMRELGLVEANPEIGADTKGIDRAMSSAERGLKNLGNIKTRPEITADASQALAVIRQVMGWLNGIPDEHVNVYVESVGTMGGPGRERKADGGTIAGRRTPYGDKVLAYLAPGEEVISNRRGQADRARPLLKRINAGRFADGGTASLSTYTSRRGSGPVMMSNELGPLAGAANQAAGALKNLERQLTKVEKAMDREKQKRDALQSRYDSILDSTISMLTSDIFAPKEAVGPVWGAGSTPGGGADPIATLQADIEEAREFDRLREALKKRGLDDGALEAAAAGGLAGLQQIAGYSQADLELYERLFNERAETVKEAGQGLAQNLVGAQLDKANAHLLDLQQEVRDVKQAIKEADKENRKGHKDTGDQVLTSVGGAAGTGGRRGAR